MRFWCTGYRSLLESWGEWRALQTKFSHLMPLFLLHNLPVLYTFNLQALFTMQTTLQCVFFKARPHITDALLYFSCLSLRLSLSVLAGLIPQPALSYSVLVVLPRGVCVGRRWWRSGGNDVGQCVQRDHGTAKGCWKAEKKIPLPASPTPNPPPPPPVCGTGFCCYPLCAPGEVTTQEDL